MRPPQSTKQMVLLNVRYLGSFSSGMVSSIWEDAVEREEPSAGYWAFIDSAIAKLIWVSSLRSVGYHIIKNSIQLAFAIERKLGLEVHTFLFFGIVEKEGGEYFRSSTSIAIKRWWSWFISKNDVYYKQLPSLINSTGSRQVLQTLTRSPGYRNAMIIKLCKSKYTCLSY